MEVRDLKYSYKSDIKDKDCGPIENAEEIETVEVGNGYVNHIIIKPEVEMTFEIEGLLTGQAVVETDDKVVDKDVENHDTCNSVNRIVVKPKIKVDCNLSGLTTTFTR